MKKKTRKIASLLIGQIPTKQLIQINGGDRRGTAHSKEDIE